MPYYAVARGFKVGVFDTWQECNSQVMGFRGFISKKFDNLEDAEEFVAQFGEGNNASSSTSVLLPNPKDITNSANYKGCFAGEHASSSASVTNSFLSETSRGTLKRTHKATVKIRAESTGRVNMCGSSKQFTAIPGADTNPHGPIVYTDGGCARNGMSNVKAGYGVFWGDGHKNNLAAPVERWATNNGRASNNGAKYRAVIAALQKAIEDDHLHITIKTDSKLLIKSMTKWPSFKKKNKLKKRDGTPVSYGRLIGLLAKLMRMIDVKFEHVEARAGIYGQEMAHKLARKGAKRYV